MSEYVQLTLWEHDGEIFTGEAPEGADAVTVSVPKVRVQQWDWAAQVAATRHREMGAYYDAALVAGGM